MPTDLVPSATPVLSFSNGDPHRLKYENMMVSDCNSDEPPCKKRYIKHRSWARAKQCKDCDGLQFGGAEEYTAHRMFQHMEGLDMVFQCRICGAIYSEKRWLNRHLRLTHFKYFCGLELSADLNIPNVVDNKDESQIASKSLSTRVKKKANPIRSSNMKFEKENDDEITFNGSWEKNICPERFQNEEDLIQHRWEKHRVEPPSAFVTDKSKNKQNQTTPMASIYRYMLENQEIDKYFNQVEFGFDTMFPTDELTEPATPQLSTDEPQKRIRTKDDDDLMMEEEDDDDNRGMTPPLKRQKLITGALITKDEGLYIDDGTLFLPEFSFSS